MDKRLFGEILVEDYAIEPEEIRRALTFQKQYGGRIGDILLNSGTVSEELICAVLEKQFALCSVKKVFREVEQLSLEPLGGCDPEWFVANEIFPLCEKEGKVYVALRDPLNLSAVETVHRMYQQKNVILLLAEDRTFREIDSAFKTRYFEPEKKDFSSQEVEKLRDLAGEAPVIKLVNSIMARAVDMRASDIHLENRSEGVVVRYRIDGVLHDVDRIVRENAMPVVSRIKILASLDIGEKRLPQDGRIQSRMSGEYYDIRVSTIPTIFGENIVMRLLKKENVRFELDFLGLEPERITQIKKLISKNHGIILVTGPTGSGKSTTLYSILNQLNVRERKIITVEDPVEYQIEGISQIQSHEQIGLSFASVLRNILRQDPDVIMIGEIRDRETADIAIRASLTGHLVLSTLHTNDSLSAITRLIDMGVDDFLVYSSVRGIIAQRLVRCVCPRCSVTESPEPEILREFNFSGKTSVSGVRPRVSASGCDYCSHTGYRGRTGVFEILELSDVVKRQLATGKEMESLLAVLQEEGFKTLREDAINKWADGRTTAEEVFRVT